MTRAFCHNTMDMRIVYLVVNLIVILQKGYCKVPHEKTRTNVSAATCVVGVKKTRELSMSFVAEHSDFS